MMGCRDDGPPPRPRHDVGTAPTTIVRDLADQKAADDTLLAGLMRRVITEGLLEVKATFVPAWAISLKSGGYSGSTVELTDEEITALRRSL